MAQKDAPHLAEHLDHLGDVLLRCRLQAELLVDSASAAFTTHVVIVRL
jgi:hypothetical protein